MAPNGQDVLKILLPCEKMVCVHYWHVYTIGICTLLAFVPASLLQAPTFFHTCKHTRKDGKENRRNTLALDELQYITHKLVILYMLVYENNFEKLKVIL